MAKYKFNLRNPSSKTETGIHFIIRWNGNRLVYPTGLSIHPKHWQGDSGKSGYQRLKNSSTLAVEYNYKLGKLQKDAEDIFYTNINRDPLTVTALRDALDIKQGKKIQHDITLYSFIDQFIKESERRTNRKGALLSNNTIRVYKQTLTHMKAFDKKGKLSFSNVDRKFYNSFLDFMREEKKFSINTMGKHIRNIKIFMNAARKVSNTIKETISDVTRDHSEFRGLSEEVQTIYLNDKEIKDILEVDLSKNKTLDNVRDLFVIGCLTGLRFSDLVKVRPEHIKNNRISIKAQKTGALVVVPLDATVLRIIKKHKGNLPPAISNQKTNVYIKDICADIKSLKVKEAITSIKQGLQVTTNIPKYELITTHTMRRSYATNKYNAGVSEGAIRAITGHKTAAAFKSYIRVTDEEKIKEIEMSNKKSNLKLA